MATRVSPALGDPVRYTENGVTYMAFVLGVDEGGLVDLLVYLPGRGWHEEIAVGQNAEDRGWSWPEAALTLDAPSSPKGKRRG